MKNNEQEFWEAASKKVGVLGVEGAIKAIEYAPRSKEHSPSEKFLLPKIIPHIDFYRTGKFDEDLVCKLDNIARRVECEESSILLEGIVLRSLAPQKTSKTKSYLKI